VLADWLRLCNCALVRTFGVPADAASYLLPIHHVVGFSADTFYNLKQFLELLPANDSPQLRFDPLENKSHF